MAVQGLGAEPAVMVAREARVRVARGKVVLARVALVPVALAQVVQAKAGQGRAAAQRVTARMADRRVTGARAALVAVRRERAIAGTRKMPERRGHPRMLRRMEP
ncbi:hypothetical protein ASG19_10120 [Rhizobium sp. Leaf306]|nr:hypothetical protein ASG19_10120 [Rhizobium sp. Leaf306]